MYLFLVPSCGSRNQTKTQTLTDPTLDPDTKKIELRQPQLEKSEKKWGKCCVREHIEVDRLYIGICRADAKKIGRKNTPDVAARPLDQTRGVQTIGEDVAIGELPYLNTLPYFKTLPYLNSPTQ